jgi:nucleoside-diphosphate-sugar epimerase
MNERPDLVLVTGASGFIGSHLVEALLARGYRVRCMVRPTSDLTFIRNLPVEWVHADLQDPESLGPACQGVNAVCHCAALTRALDKETFMRVNAQAAETLARACLDVNTSKEASREVGLKRFLYISSHAACGPSQGADDFVDELTLPQPVTWYGQSKLAAERALLALGDRLPLTIVRPASVFGPRDPDFYTYFELVNRGLSLRLGREERRVSLIYIRDLVRLILLALESETALGQTYFGCNQAHSFAEFSEAIAGVLKKRPVRIRLPEAVLTPLVLWSRVKGRVTGRPARLNDQWILGIRQPYWLCSGEKARRELGFTAEYELESAVRETANWYLESEWL